MTQLSPAECKTMSLAIPSTQESRASRNGSKSRGRGPRRVRCFGREWLLFFFTSGLCRVIRFGGGFTVPCTHLRTDQTRAAS